MKTRAQLTSKLETMSLKELRKFAEAIVWTRYGHCEPGQVWTLDQNEPEHNEMLMTIEADIEQAGLNPDSL